MDIADYIPNYPELDDPKFNDKVLHKKEFYDFRTGTEPSPFGEPGDLWPHQRLLSRFISPHTSYDDQLLFHTPGTGKTCGASAIVEINKQDPLVRKPVLVIVPNETLVNQWKQQIALVCTTGQYIPENYFNLDPNEKLTSGEKIVRVNKLLSPVYHITTIEKMRRTIDKLSDQILKTRYSNTLIIIDEAHNLRIESHTSKKNVVDSKGRYNSFHRFLHLVENCKKLLLSGTPMFDRVTELPGIMNLILPLDNQMPTGAKFTKRFLEKKGHIRKIKNADELYPYLVGRVSYIREGGNFPTREDLGATVWTKFIKTLNMEMSTLQLTGYNEAYAKDKDLTENKTTGLYKNSRQAASFVYKDKGKYLWGTAATALLMAKSKPKKLKIEGREMTYTPVHIKSQYAADIKKNLAEYSSKYQEIVTFLSENTTPTFIFTPLVSGAGGAIFLGLVLELFGFSKALGTTSTASKRYAIITGDDKSSIQRKRLIDLYNSPNNINGEIIQVMIATKTISEGTSFTNVRNEIVVSPYWNNSGTEQAIGRGLRANSLASLPDKDRVVTVQQLATTSPKLPEDKNIDAEMYKMSEGKDFEIKDGERVLKTAAWDCALNYARNVRKKDKDNSRSCDYQKCNYVCYQTTPKKISPKWSYAVPEDELDESTFLLYYSRPELLKVVEKVKGLLKVYSYIDIRGLNQYLNIENFKLLVLAIEYIIENHVTVHNRWGQACFLRKEGNMLFLSDVPTETEILGSWYANYPYANSQVPLSQVIDDELFTQDLPIMDEIDLDDLSESKKVIDAMSLETKIFILESLLTLNPETMTKAQHKKYELFAQIFKNHVFTIDETLVHDLQKTKLSQDFVDFDAGEGGSLRCLKGGVWTDCGKKEEEELSKIIKSLKEEVTEDIVKNDFGVYGIIAADGKFRIADKTKEKSGAKSDKRGVFRGKVCTAGWKKWELIELYVRLDIDTPNALDTSIKNKDALIAEIKKNKTDAAIPKNPNVAVLQKILTLSKLDIKALCKKMETWFVANKLVIKDK